MTWLRKFKTYATGWNKEAAKRMRMWRLLLVLGGLTGSALAQDAAVASATDPAAQLEALFQRIKEQPQNLDANFAYAKLAGQLQRYDEALAAYERMLIVNPNLHRVKLDMAVVYVATGNFDKAETLLREVLTINPPDAVQNNIQKMLSEIGSRRQRHFVNGSLTVGWNADSNGNAGPASGNQDVLGVSIPLGDSAQEATDDQLFGALSLRHSFRFSGGLGNSWVTEALYYRTEQASLTNLDITLKSLKTGPVWVFPHLKSRVGVAVQYTDVNLDHVDYQQTWRKQLEWIYNFHPQLQLGFVGAHDLKRHQNSASSSLYTLRNGEAWEFKTTATYAYSPKTTFVLGYTYHDEQTTANYYSYQSNDFDMKALHQLPWYDLTALAGLNFTHTEYRAIDTSVNPDTLRRDNLRSWSLAVSKPVTDNTTLSVGYTFKDVDSSIQNYTYENERWSASLTRRF